MAEPERRRRRLRRPAEGRPPGAPDAPVQDPPTAVTPEVQDPEPPPVTRAASDDRDTERGLRGLVGSGSSQVGTSAAMRARDAARPTAADLAEAEERLVIVRRNWVPRDEPPRSR